MKTLWWWWEELDNFDRYGWQGDGDIRSVAVADNEPGRPGWLIVLHPTALDSNGDPVEPVRFYGAPLARLFASAVGPIPPDGDPVWTPIVDDGEAFRVTFED